MAKDHRPSVKDDKQYEGLRKQGMSKPRAGPLPFPIRPGTPRTAARTPPAAAAVDSSRHLPPGPSCGNANWNTVTGRDSVNDPYPDLTA